jgi:hypothetical protein
MTNALRDAANNPLVRRLGMVLGAGLALWALLALVRVLRADRLEGLALARVDTAAVDTVVLAWRGDTARLVRGAGGRWTANGFAADTGRIHELLRALADTGAWSELSASNASSHKRLGVSPDSGRYVRVVTGAKTPMDLVIGRRTADWTGVFARLPAEDAVYALHSSDMATAFTRNAEDWRDKRIASVTPDSVGSVMLKRGARTIALRRAGAAWTMDGAAADSSAVASLLEAYRDLSAMGFATPAQSDSAKLTSPRYSVTIRSRAGVSLLTLAMDSIASGIYARSDTGRVIYRLDAWQGPRLVPADTALRRKTGKQPAR